MVNQKKLFRQINGNNNNNVQNITRDAEMAKEFWRNIWERGTTHNGEAECVENVMGKVNEKNR